LSWRARLSTSSSPDLEAPDERALRFLPAARSGRRQESRRTTWMPSSLLPMWRDRPGVPPTPLPAHPTSGRAGDEPRESRGSGVAQYGVVSRGGMTVLRSHTHLPSAKSEILRTSSKLMVTLVRQRIRETASNVHDAALLIRFPTSLEVSLAAATVFEPDRAEGLMRLSYRTSLGSGHCRLRGELHE